MLRLNQRSITLASMSLFLFGVLATVAQSLQAQQPFGGRPRFTQPTPLPPVVTGLIDGTENPSISGDGLTIYYGGYADLSKHPRIWQATRLSVDSEWQDARPLSDAVNSSLRQTEPEVTADGLELFYRASDVDKNYDWWLPSDTLMVATRASTAEDWTEAQPLPDIINDIPCVGMPAVTGDGLELYFAVKDTFVSRCHGRNADVYVTKRANRDAPWGEPELVEPIAASPGVSPDGLTLYLNVGERAGMDLPNGSFGDGPTVFVRTRASRDEDFGPAVELGEPINTSSAFYKAWGPEPSSDGETLYFASDRPGTPNNFAVWQATLAEPCDINRDGSCDVDDLTPSSLFRVNLLEGSDRESDVLKYDVSGDGRVDSGDLVTWLAEAATSNGLESPFVRGDANLDGQFDSGDLVNVFQTGKYEVGSEASWAEGDWNGDQRFDSGDLVAAFQDGGYEQGPRVALNVVPEPASLPMLITGFIGVVIRRRAVDYAND